MTVLFSRDTMYPHRMNYDGTIDSICPYCYLTIGTSIWEADLEEMEAIHVCDIPRVTTFSLAERPLMLGRELLSPRYRPRTA